MGERQGEYKLQFRPALALYQPDIAGNTGTLIRLSACLGTHLHIIEPAGFRTDDSNLRRAGMDYRDLARITRHADFNAFAAFARQENSRVILLSTRATLPYDRFDFRPDDIIMLGRESSGVPDRVHDEVEARLLIPMEPQARSLNQAICAAMVLGEALRQTGGFHAVIP